MEIPGGAKGVCPLQSVSSEVSQHRGHGKGSPWARRRASAQAQQRVAPAKPQE